MKNVCKVFSFFIMVVVIGHIFSSCTTSTANVHVSNIIGVPEAAIVGFPLTLSGIVFPENTNARDIEWSVLNAGTTWATINGNILNAAEAGTVIVTATVADGLGYSQNTTDEQGYRIPIPYTQNFAITVVPPAVRTVTFNSNNTDASSIEANPQILTVSPTTVSIGSLPSPPARPDYFFHGWNMQADGSGTSFTTTTFVPENITVYAMWGTHPVIEMVWIPGGRFEMGRNLGDGEGNNVTPVSTVTLSGFYMGIYLVTQELYQAVMGSNPSHFHGGSGSELFAGEIQGWRPVESVSWYDALVFCNRLSIMEGLSPAYSLNNSTNPDNWGSVPTARNTTWDAVQVLSSSTGYRLPTEAQWEYAAKGGNSSPGSFSYSGSNDPEAVAWYHANSNSMTHQVGLKQPNGLGLYDMSGNVWEWCWDWWSSYTRRAKTNPTGPASGSYRVLRGGSWFHDGPFLRSVYRGSIGSPLYRTHNVGFRLVRP